MSVAAKQQDQALGAGDTPLGLSRSLFWDLPAESRIDVQGQADLIICRVVELGRLDDWRAVRRHYGDEAMKKAVTTARDLSAQGVALCCTAFGLRKEDFRCCTSKPFHRSPWI